MASDTPARDQDKFVLRLPDGMRSRIARKAKESGRSMNAEIVQVLEMYYPPDPPAEEIAQIIEGIIKMNHGDPPKEQWGDIFQLLVEFKARLMRDAIAEKYGSDAASEFERNRAK